jgi:hypothetical protein
MASGGEVNTRQYTLFGLAIINAVPSVSPMIPNLFLEKL